MGEQTRASGNELRLTGGIFFTLLVITKVNCIGKPRKKSFGAGEPHTNPEMLAALTRLGDPDFKISDADSYRPQVSNYKSCQQAEGENLPFTLPTYITETDLSVRENYAQQYTQMDDFVQTFMPTLKKNDANRIALIRTMNTLILNDPTYEDTMPLWIGPKGKIYSKGDLKNMKMFDFTAYLLGMWHAVITHQPDNTVGRSTYDRFFRGRKERGFDYMPILNAGKIRPPADILLTPPIDPDDSKPRDKHPASAESAFDLSPFLQKLIDRFSMMRTVLYRSRPREILDFHVCNDLWINDDFNCLDELDPPEIDRDDNPNVIRDATIAQLTACCSRLIILKGAGGMGKTMLMRRLFLEGAMPVINAGVNTGSIPIYIELKSLGDLSFENYLFNMITAVQPFSKNDLDELLTQQSCCFILDGLEELDELIASAVTKELIDFSTRYDRHCMIISSRPISQFMDFDQFSVLQLLPFEPEQSALLVENLDVPNDAKQAFQKLLRDELRALYPSFVSNPLMLTIMLRIYVKRRMIPLKLSAFYREVYDTLIHREINANTYHFKTGLNTPEFEKIFGELCYLATCRERKTLTDSIFEKLFEIMITPKKYQIELQDFIDDCCVTTGLIVRYDTQYSFLHPLFREYFCALYVAGQDDVVMAYFGDWLGKQSLQDPKDPMLTLLYEMNPEDVKRCIFIPQLALFFSGDSDEYNYDAYLLRNYPEINCISGGVIATANNRPHSLIVAFILENTDIPTTPGIKDLPICEPFVLSRYHADEGAVDFRNILQSHISGTKPSPPITFRSGERCLMKIPVIEVLKYHATKYAEMYAAIHDADFPLYQEYLAVKDYYERSVVRV